ncbi:MAG: histidine kinase [Rhodobacteraceae bacterium]|nr:histidine kinase [Paracoccaceae bacterium]MBR9822813.1 histidine kinase [Paracoccaceae bacterium]
MPLIAIGASAGGLDPLESFFDIAPRNAGWCYVVIQHLSPDYRSMMDELLSRRSSMRIVHIDDGMVPEPDTIYLNRPNVQVWLEGRKFHVSSFNPDEALPHLPIDTFLTSLSKSRDLRSCAVILSGSGSDGTRGAQAMRAAGRPVFVQSPQEAAFGSMPRSALTVGAADRVLPVAEIPEAVNRMLEGMDVPKTESVTDPDVQAVITLLQRHHQVDFSAYKTANVHRRIERRQHLRGISQVREYFALLEQSPSALEELYHDLLIGVTEFYRDRDAFRHLREKVLEPLVARSSDDSSLRIWVPGCASGEEAYTIAIELSEVLRSAGIDRKFRIIATDMHRGSIEKASLGLFSAQAMDKIAPDLRDRYFNRVDDHYIIDPVLRQKLIFSIHDVLSDPPFLQIDLITCRNLLIYLSEEAQTRVISMFLFGLRQNGYLMLGPSESLGRFVSDFDQLNGRWRIYRNVSKRSSQDRFLSVGPRPAFPRMDLDMAEARRPAPAVPQTLPRGHSLQTDRDRLVHTYDALLKRYAPSSIVITVEGGVLAWFGLAAAYIDTLNNLADWTVEEIVHADLHFVINVGIERLRKGEDGAYERKVKVTLGENEVHSLAVKMETLQSKGQFRCILVSITRIENFEGPRPPEAEQGAIQQAVDDETMLSRRIQELERDLRLTEETLQHVTERLEASGEELQASNEELQASNEELQASNEELQSSNEELHAVNEELVSVSAEHERKIEMLSELNRDMELVLGFLKLGVIVLDEGLRIRRFSRLIGEVFHMEEHDVDRMLDVVGPRPGFVDLADLAREVLEGDRFVSRSGTYGRSPLQIRCFPFDRVLDGRQLRGVLMIFSGDELFSA